MSNFVFKKLVLIIMYLQVHYLRNYIINTTSKRQKPNLLKFCIVLSIDPNAELMEADVLV
jgi:hypothetical protein